VGQQIMDQYRSLERHHRITALARHAHIRKRWKMPGHWLAQ
jgi:hypothetical protein